METCTRQNKKTGSPLTVLKPRIKIWITVIGPYRLCKTFVKDLGFIEVCPNI